MIPPDATVRRSAELVYRELPEGAGLMHLGSGAFYELNTTGALIWELIEGGVTFDELVSSLESSIDEPPAGLAEEVRGFLDDLVERKLVEVVTPPG